METNARRTVLFGDLVAAVFDVVEKHVSDPREIAQVATTVIAGALQRARSVTPLVVDPRFWLRGAEGISRGLTPPPRVRDAGPL